MEGIDGTFPHLNAALRLRQMLIFGPCAAAVARCQAQTPLPVRQLECAAKRYRICVLRLRRHEACSRGLARVRTIRTGYLQSDRPHHIYCLPCVISLLLVHPHLHFVAQVVSMRISIPELPWMTNAMKPLLRCRRPLPLHCGGMRLGFTRAIAAPCTHVRRPRTRCKRERD